MKTIFRHLILAFISLTILFFTCHSSQPDEPAVSTYRPAADLRDSAVFFAQLRLAFQQKDAALLSTLMADHVRSGYLNEAQECARAGGCPKAELIRAAFQGPDAEGWTKFAVVWRMGFSKQFEDGKGGFYVGPGYPGLDDLTQYHKAYIFADKVQVRAAPGETAKVLMQKSRCWAPVDTDALCYDDVPGDWLPVILDQEKTGYVYIHLTSWSKQNGFIIVRKDAGRVFRITEMNYFDASPGAWYLPGCC